MDLTSKIVCNTHLNLQVDTPRESERVHKCWLKRTEKESFTLLHPSVKPLATKFAVQRISQPATNSRTSGYKPQHRLHHDQAHLNSFRTVTGFFWLCWASLQDQFWNFMVRLMQSQSPFQWWQLVCFRSKTGFLTVYRSLFYSMHVSKIWKRSAEKHKSYETLRKTIHFL